MQQKPLDSLVAGPKLDSLLTTLRSLRAVPGCVVELGVYRGGTLIALANAAPDRLCYGYDTFTGLPASAWHAGEPHSVGYFGDASLDALRAALPANARIVAGEFPGSATEDVGPIALAHVDFDYEQSTRDAIAWLLPRLSPGSAVVFDDVGWRYCPGVRRAIDAAGLHVDRLHEYQYVYRHE